jgi:hypothetical protein
MLTSDASSPESLQELSSDVSVAFLLLLERLTPEARAAFVLREVLDSDYPEIALTLGKTEAACRQLVHRAKEQIRDERPRQAATPEAHRQLMHRFAEALSMGDFPAIRSMLATDAVLMGDGGGKVTSFPKPMLGGQRIAQLFYAANLRYKYGLRLELATINGETSLLRYLNGALESVQTYVVDGEHITQIHIQRNPDKLARILQALH